MSEIKSPYNKPVNPKLIRAYVMYLREQVRFLKNRQNKSPAPPEAKAIKTLIAEYKNEIDYLLKAL